MTERGDTLRDIEARVIKYAQERVIETDQDITVHFSVEMQTDHEDEDEIWQDTLRFRVDASWDGATTSAAVTEYSHSDEVPIKDVTRAIAECAADGSPIVQLWAAEGWSHMFPVVLNLSLGEAYRLIGKLQYAIKEAEGYH